MYEFWERPKQSRIATSNNLVATSTSTSDGLMMTVSMAFVVDLGNETVLVSVVFHVTDFVVGLDEAVESFHVLSITGLPLALDVVVMGIVDWVVEMVMWMGLEKKCPCSFQHKKEIVIPDSLSSSPFSSMWIIRIHKILKLFGR